MVAKLAVYGLLSQKRMYISVYKQVNWREAPGVGLDLHSLSLVMPSLRSLVDDFNDM